MDEIQIRVGIDWDEDGIINWSPSPLRNMFSGLGHSHVTNVGATMAPATTAYVTSLVVEDEESVINGFPYERIPYNASYQWTAWPVTGVNASGVATTTSDSEVTVVSGTQYVIQVWM